MVPDEKFYVVHHNIFSCEKRMVIWSEHSHPRLEGCTIASLISTWNSLLLPIDAPVELIPDQSEFRKDK